MKESNILFIDKEKNEVSREIQDYYNKWLQMSGIKETDLLLCRLYKYKIKGYMYNSWYICEVGYLDKDKNFIKVGKELMANNENGITDLYLLLLCIASKLDNASSKDPEFQRDNNCKYRFYEETKKFITESISELKQITHRE